MTKKELEDYRYKRLEPVSYTHLVWISQLGVGDLPAGQQTPASAGAEIPGYRPPFGGSGRYGRGSCGRTAR